MSATRRAVRTVAPLRLKKLPVTGHEPGHQHSIDTGLEGYTVDWPAEHDRGREPDETQIYHEVVCFRACDQILLAQENRNHIIVTWYGGEQILIFSHLAAGTCSGFGCKRGSDVCRCGDEGPFDGLNCEYCR